MKTIIDNGINQINFTEFQVQLRCCLIIKDGFDNEWMHDFYADYKEDFGVKMTVKEWAKDFFQDVTLDTHSYCLVSKIAKPTPVLQEVGETVEEAADRYATDMQNGNVTNDELFVSEMDIYLSVAKWQSNQSGLISKDKVIELIKSKIVISDNLNGRLPESTCGYNNALTGVLSDLNHL